MNTSLVAEWDTRAKLIKLLTPSCYGADRQMEKRNSLQFELKQELA